MKHISQIITAIGTAASIVSLAFSFIMPVWLRVCVTLFGLFCFCFLVYDEIKRNTANERICKCTDDVNDAMKDIIESQGNICIMSRDLSWVNYDIAASLVHKKENVLIFAQSRNEITEELVNQGVKIKFYGNTGFEPKTRFTIIRYNRNDPQVAIANIKNSIRKKRKFRHIIYQTCSSGNPQDEWINSLAIDMVNLCNAVSKE